MIKRKRIMQKWIFRFIFLFLLANLVIDTSGQEISFYDQDWNRTNKENAQFYFVTIDSIPIYRIGTIAKYEKRLAKYERKISRNIRREIGEKEIYKIDFSNSENDSVLIGKRVKIFSQGEHYDYLCRSSNDSIDWPSAEIKYKSGICSDKWKAPHEGDTGIIVWRFNNFKTSTGKTVFIIKIENYYIPIAGQSLTFIDKLSSDEIEHIKATKHPKRYLRKKNKIGQI